MRLFILLISLAIARGFTAGCIERIDADLPYDKSAGAAPVDWHLAGSFGGNGEIINPGEEPYDMRCAPGGFMEISGICATDDEVWVCDLGVSRVQVFDFKGNHLYDVGSGVVLEGTLPTHAELYRDESGDVQQNTDWWDDGEGRRWVGGRREMFRAADVIVTDGGYWLADWTKTSVGRKAKRDAAVYFVPEQGAVKELPSKDLAWPTHIALEDGSFACSDPESNSFWLAEVSEDPWLTETVSRGGTFLALMQLNYEYEGPEYVQLHRRITGASRSPGGFNGIGGVAVAFDKVIACDPGNSRLQVFEGRHSPRPLWGELARVISAKSDQGRLRFRTPVDIDVAADGTVFVLDIFRREVAVLSADFRRIGAFGGDELIEPRALDLSDDGKHCFITDSRQNQVFHYAARD